jgi:hypothetical protein
MKNGRNLWDPIKHIDMYEDVSYKSKFEDEKIVDEDRETLIDMQPRGAEAHAPTPGSMAQSSRVSHGSNKRAGGNADAPPLKNSPVATHKKMHKLVSLLALVKVELSSCLNKVNNPDMSALVPVYVVTSAEDTHTKVEACHDQAQT